MNTASDVMESAPGVRARAVDAWTAFWADADQSRCAAGAPEIGLALTNHWSNFARSLAPGTPILDLGCGACAVGRLVVGASADLHVTGIDAATTPRTPHPRIDVLSHTAMEALPFTGRRFGAVVSQFGYEYSRIDVTAREVARVVTPGARLSLLVHHDESAIVASTRARLDAIERLLGASLRAAFCAGDAAGFHAQMTALIALHPHDDLVACLARALQPRVASPQAKRIATWSAIEEALAPERCVSEALCECCVPALRLDEWLEPLRATCRLLPVSVLREPNGAAIAWKIEGVYAG
ncbi:MAG TPA: class I SAM-dependent methyltransferase [Steroidobacteraceae bacterium]